MTFGAAATYLRRMRVPTGIAVVVATALATSACGGSHSAHSQPPTTAATTDAIQLHELTYGRLPQSLQSYLRSIEAGKTDGPVNEIDVYGPGSRAALVKASSGDIVYESAREQQESFYLVVLHGQFVCRGCSGPAGHKPPQGTVETDVWSPAEGGTDFGIGNGVPAAVSHLHPLAVITMS